MNPTHPIRLTQALVLAAIVAAFATPTAALGSTNPGKPTPDWFERYAAAHPYGEGVVGSTQAPDWFERYAAAHPFGRGVVGSTQAPDWFERYAAAHPYGEGVVGSSSTSDVFKRDAATYAPTVLTNGRSPDTIGDATDAARRQATAGRSPDTIGDAADAARRQLADKRSPDTLPTAQAAQTTQIVQPGRFDWADASIGAIFAVMMIVFVGGGMLLLGRFHRRPRVQTT
jgi:hypothetical protein